MAAEIDEDVEAFRKRLDTIVRDAYSYQQPGVGIVEEIVEFEPFVFDVDVGEPQIVFKGGERSLGACCYIDPMGDPTVTVCADNQTRGACDALDGDFASGQHCSDNPCPGACCEDDGMGGVICEDLAEAECAAVGGDFKGIDTACDDDPDPCVTCPDITVLCSQSSVARTKCGGARTTADWPFDDPTVHYYRHLEMTGSWDFTCTNSFCGGIGNCESADRRTAVWDSDWDGLSGSGCASLSSCDDEYSETYDNPDCNFSASDFSCLGPASGDSLPGDLCIRGGPSTSTTICGNQAFDVDDSSFGIDFQHLDLFPHDGACSGSGSVDCNYSNELTTTELVSQAISILPEPSTATETYFPCSGEITSVRLNQYNAHCDITEGRIAFRIASPLTTDLIVKWTELTVLHDFSTDTVISSICRTTTILAGVITSDPQLISYSDITPYLPGCISAFTGPSIGTTITDVSCGACP